MKLRKKKREVRRPYLIQRCEICNGKLRYDYMGSAEFEIGDQTKSLKRIFEAGIITGTLSVELEGTEMKVHMISYKGFPFSEYQRFLQTLAENKLRLQECAYFDKAIKTNLGHTDVMYGTPPDAWFDFKNDVLWTLSESSQQELLSILNNIKKMWS